MNKLFESVDSLFSSNSSVILEAEFIPATWDDAIGTSYLTVINPDINPNDLEKVLGPSLGPSSDGKSDYNWIVKYNDEVFAVYDYKGDRWHIGGETDSNVNGFIEALTNGLGSLSEDEESKSERGHKEFYDYIVNTIKNGDSKNEKRPCTVCDFSNIEIAPFNESDPYYFNIIFKNIPDSSNNKYVESYLVTNFIETDGYYKPINSITLSDGSYILDIDTRVADETFNTVKPFTAILDEIYDIVYNNIA